ncbi:MAG: 4Fe-4S dicluster domain-containing protein [Rhodospirillum sp.]|nr:4Fe-4S dicluster domain-containing protein [Rhodospirillum sp.]MCF8492067.1 4Fe-4S dicluster domain-containing protein [Rhodospirillum sp.]
MTRHGAGWPDRWDRPFGGDPLSDGDLEKALALPQFVFTEEEGFSPRMPFREILRHDTRVVRYRRGEVVTLAGSYGSSVYFILSGSVRVFVDRENDPALSRRRKAVRGSWGRALARVGRKPGPPEVRPDPKGTGGGALAGLALRGGGDDRRVFIRDLDRAIETTKTVTLVDGLMFGEISALARTPRTASVVADQDLEVLEMRWQGLREIRRRDPVFRGVLDRAYRERSLRNHLAESPLLAHLDAEALKTLSEHTAFETHGDFEWSATFRRIQGQDYTFDAKEARDLMATEPLIAEEGTLPEGLLLIRQGFARVSRGLDQGHLTVDYATAGEVFGLEELVAQARTGKPHPLRHRLSAVGYVDILRVPTNLALKLILPNLPAEFQRQDRGWDGEGKAESSAGIGAGIGDGEGLTGLNRTQAFLDFVVDNRIINGTSAMFIDTERCVGCDDCVSACAVNHDGDPRFIRHGPEHGSWMVANACMHCVDPVCLIGCPTGAINREDGSGDVLIDDDACIGCGACAQACAYGNIRMVDVRNTDGTPRMDGETGQVIKKATKCDLCAGSPGGPACVRACPHDALQRVDMRDRATVRTLAERLPGRRWMRRAGDLALGGVLLVGLLLGLEAYGGDLGDTRFASGWILGGLVLAMASFNIRKKLPSLPLGRAATWTRIHVVLGMVALGLFAYHGGARAPDGLLEVGLWVLFLGTAGSGLVGLALSRLLPRRSGRDGERLLFDRIPRLRAELETQAEAAVLRAVEATGSEAIRSFHEGVLAPYFADVRNIGAHLLGGTPLADMDRRLAALERYLEADGREALAEIRRFVEAKDNLDRQYARQAATRGWLFLHVPLTLATVIAALAHLVVIQAFSPWGL